MEWTIQQAAGTQPGGLDQVSCPSLTACVTVRPGRSEEEPSIVERWNGTEWQVQKTPTPEHEGHPARLTTLRGLSCPSTAECTIVGSDRYGEGLFSLAEHWNGAEWLIQPTPNPSGLQVLEPELETVSCSSASSCTAAGKDTNEEDFAEHWNGVEWTVEQSAATVGNTVPRGISCVEPEEEVCIFVGLTNTGRGFMPLIEQEAITVPFVEREETTNIGETSATLNGAVNPNGEKAKYYFEYGTTSTYGTKTAEASAGTGTTKKSRSKSITGLTANTTYHYRVVATNSHGANYGPDQTFTTLGWRTTATPTPENTENSYLTDVSCTAPTACIAVGKYSPNANETDKLLSETWNGSEWSLRLLPNPAGKEKTALYGVSCASTSSCVAVGYYENNSGVVLSLVESWNGTEWKIQPMAEPPGSESGLLSDVSCTSTKACTAVGWYEPSAGVEVPWATRWNGKEWSAQTMPSPNGASLAYPEGVSCASSNTCMLVGYYENSSHAQIPFTEKWNGTEWAVQATPTPSGSTGSVPVGVSCTSATACTMVGRYETPSSERYLPLAERWNGTEWSLQSAAIPSGSTNTLLYGVSCVSTSVCTAVGVASHGALAEAWNGTEWIVQATPNNGATLLEGVSCTSLVSCAAVGSTTKMAAEIYG